MLAVQQALWHGEIQRIGEQIQWSITGHVAPVELEVPRTRGSTYLDGGLRAALCAASRYFRESVSQCGDV